MRVIAGEFRGRKLFAPRGLTTRPTPDRLRESLFSILQPEIEGVTFVDAFAGSGSVGIEALSRGARHAIFIERSRMAVEVLKENLESLKLGNRAEVFTGKVAHVLAHKRGDIVFLDPPYDMEPEYDYALAAVAARPPQLLIVQHSGRYDPGERHGLLERKRVLRQGDNSLTFYRLP